MITVSWNSITQTSTACLFIADCLCGTVSHVGRWGKWSSRCFPPNTPPRRPPPGCSLYHTGTRQRAQRSGCALGPDRAGSVPACRSLWPLTPKTGKRFINLLLSLFKHLTAELHTFTLRSRRAPRAIRQTNERLRAD